MRNLLVALAVAACAPATNGDGPTPGSSPDLAQATPDLVQSTTSTAIQPDYKAGTRLKVRVQTTSDGAKMAVGFYDTQLGFNCWIQRAADDMARCVPSDYNASVATSYSDDQCTQAVNVTFDDCAGKVPAYAVIVETANSCVTFDGYPDVRREHVYPVTSTPYTGPLYQRVGSCNAISYHAAFLLGSELPASMLVSATITLE